MRADFPKRQISTLVRAEERKEYSNPFENVYLAISPNPKLMTCMVTSGSFVPTSQISSESSLTGITAISPSITSKSLSFPNSSPTWKVLAA